jgi:hypothetical protein
VPPTSSRSRCVCPGGLSASSAFAPRALQVYGSELERSNALRAWSEGKLLMDSTPVGPMLPRNIGLLPNANDAHAFPDDQLFLAGGTDDCCGMVVLQHVCIPGRLENQFWQ